MAEKWILSSIILALISLSVAVNAAVPAIFILGDSTADVGTNNHIPTYARADHPFNGIDYPGSVPTGRFSNGLNSADFLAKQFGFNRSPPPFLAITNGSSNFSGNVKMYKHVLRGVNFASGGSGLLIGTGKIYGRVIPFAEQIQQFSAVKMAMENMWGPVVANGYVSKSLIIISVGSNDIFEFFTSNGTLANKPDYVNYLTSTYSDHLRSLYSIGVRKFAIISVPPIGCCPSQRNKTTGKCSDDLNEYAQMFYSTIQILLPKLKIELTEMQYSIGNSYEMVRNFMENPLPFNFTELRSACCGNGTLNGETPCSSGVNLCPNRDQYLFWDMYHPTQAASQLAALTLYGGGKKFVTPMNFQQLGEL